MKPIIRHLSLLMILSGVLILPASAASNPPLAAQVEALPEKTVAEQLKKSVLRVALERVALAADDPAYATELQTDIAAALPVSADTFVADGPDLSHVSALRPVPAPATNPHVAQMVDGVRTELTKPSLPLVKATAATSALGKLPYYYSSARTIAARMEALVWLFANPGSPLRDDPAVLALFLRQAHAYADTLDVTGGATAGKDLLDDFAITPASGALREFAALRPGLLLPSQRRQWDRAMRRAGDSMAGKAKGRDGTYPNIDIALSLELLNFGLYLRDDAFLAQSRFLLHAQEKNIYPDGAMAYIWHQNETQGYQGVVVNYIRRYGEITGDPVCAAMLRRLEPFDLVIGGLLPDWWTTPSWKHTWNANGEPDPYSLPEVPKDNRRWERAFYRVATFDPAAKPRPRPDNYTFLDRNVIGPRAWYGRWNYAATLRSIPATEPGFDTIMGAQIADADKPHSINAALMGVAPRVSFKTSRNKPAWAWLTSDLTSALTMGRRFSALSARYELATWGSSMKGEVAPGWVGRQTWLGLPDRLIGLLAIEPSRDGAAAFETGAAIRLGTGGTVYGKPQTIQTLSPGHFRYGDMMVSVLEHNFAIIEPVVVPFRLPAAPVTELTFRDAASAKAASGQTTAYKLGDRFYCVVELRPAWVKDEAVVHRTQAADGSLVLQVDTPGTRHTLYFNPTDRDVPCGLAARLPSGAVSTLHFSENAARAPQTPCPSQAVIPACQQLVVVSSADPLDRLPRWKNFDEMLSAQ
jgi:hypothetical protein